MKNHPCGKVWLSESGIKAIPPWICGFCEPLSPCNDDFLTNLVINLFIGTEVKPFTEIVQETSPNVIQKKTLLCITTSESTPCPPSEIIKLYKPFQVSSFPEMSEKIQVSDLRIGAPLIETHPQNQHESYVSPSYHCLRFPNHWAFSKPFFATQISELDFKSSFLFLPLPLTLLLMVHNPKQPPGMVLNPGKVDKNGRFQLPSSTGEFTGFLNHQQDPPNVVLEAGLRTHCDHLFQFRLQDLPLEPWVPRNAERPMEHPYPQEENKSLKLAFAKHSFRFISTNTPMINKHRIHEWYWKFPYPARFQTSLSVFFFWGEERWPESTDQRPSDGLRFSLWSWRESMGTSGGTVELLRILSTGMSIYPLRIHGNCIFTYIWLICMVNVGRYTIHGCYGILPCKWIISPLYT